MFKLTVDLAITPINRFYKRDVDIAAVGQPNRDYIFVAGVENETGTYFYYNFMDFDYLFSPCNKLLTCDKKYIDENFTRININDLREDLR